jgi:threonine dehydrogenase-like Zn-dependent dehydrogenase
MRGLWLENRQLQLRGDLPRPEVRDGETLVRVLLAGICNTDIELTRGYYPFAGIPGHEFVGVVEEGPAALRGRRVVGEINAVCHQCNTCRAGRTSHCERRTVLGIVHRNGAFAEYLTLPAENLHPVPESISDEEAVFIEPLAAALEIQQQVRIGQADRVLVVGDGKLGQLVARTLALTGCELSVAGRYLEKRALLEREGIRTVSAHEVTPRAFDIAVECSGNSEGFALARKGLRPRGTLVMKSTYAGDLTLNASSLVVDEITLVGSRCGPFQAALQLLAGRTIDPRPLIHARHALDDAIAAFTTAQRPGALKVIVRIAA